MEFERAPGANVRWAQHLECWRRLSYAGRLVRHDGSLWFVKSGWEKHAGARERDRLGYVLGRGIVNVAEVRALHPGQVAELRTIGVELRADLPTDRVWLSRFVGESEPDALPHQTLDGAMASELAYSLWIRRRDAHAFNRAFVGGLPMFFDHETAFLGEPELTKLSAFFRTGDSPGYAGLWRVDTGSHHALDTCVQRHQERKRFAAAGDHPVLLPAHRHARFMDAIDETCDAIRSIPREEIASRIAEAGFEGREAKAVLAFLLRNRARLTRDAAVLKRLLDAPLSERQPKPPLLVRAAARLRASVGL